MGDLRELCAKLGYEDVRTYVQSGNVVLTSRAGPERVARELERAIADELGVETAVVVRTRDELAGVVERNPLADVADEPKRLQVSFLSAEPDRGGRRGARGGRLRARALRRQRPRDLRLAPRGAAALEAGARLSDSRLGVVATARNWNTVTKLLGMADE